MPDEYVIASLEAGADGYIIKDAIYDELLVAIRRDLFEPADCRQGG